MINEIIKRDGRKVLFDKEKIVQAIFKAAAAVGGKDREVASDLADQVVEYLETEMGENCTPTVEHVQDVVEKILINNGHARTAKEYILYRADRTRVRTMNTKLMRIYEDLTFKSAKDNDI
ncbi:MAG: anaerobic ribonucleoside triphosphate reductase, partial [Clostridia bacterium]|nr:anaerobic ribonucleoside triphosphate reductase [Clostridia bacterium]